MATGIEKTKWNGDVITDVPSDDLASANLQTSLCYEGRMPASDVLATPPAQIEEIWRGTSTQNRLYFGDNLAILALLLQDGGVCGQVKLVYIDPPFSTDRVFQSRKQVDAYSDTLVGAHYIEFLRRRLILLRELLAEDGSIYVHLDQNMLFHVKVIMDEIFGADNFCGLITRKKCNPKNYTRKTYGNISDHILYYARSRNPIWNRAYVPWSEERADAEYRHIEPGTKRRYKRVPIHAPGTRKGATGQPWRGKLPPPGKHWQYPPATLDELDARGEIYWSPTGNPRRKVYLDQSQGIPIQDIWLDVKDAHNQMIQITGYPTEKPRELLTRIVEASSNEDDLVLDCFAGSGTTLAVASKLGRRWIGIDNSSEAIATTMKRLAHGMERMGDFVNTQEPESKGALPLFAFANLDETLPDGDDSGQDKHLVDDFCLYSVVTHSRSLLRALKLR